MSGAGKLVYHLPKDSGKYALKVNEHDSLVVPAENFREQRNIWKGSPVLPDELFQTKILVPFLQSHTEIFSIVSGART